jgi:hypothetical protein
MRSSSHTLDRVEVVFDDDRAVADGGLLLPMMLAEHLGLRALVDYHVDLGDARGRANVGLKAVALTVHQAETLDRAQPIAPQPQPQDLTDLIHTNLPEAHRHLPGPLIGQVATPTSAAPPLVDPQRWSHDWRKGGPVLPAKLTAVVPYRWRATLIMSIGFLADFNGAPLVGSVWVGANTVPDQGTRSVDAQTRSEDFYTATSEDIHLATREDFFMATDTLSAR